MTFLRDTLIWATAYTMTGDKAEDPEWSRLAKPSSLYIIQVL